MCGIVQFFFFFLTITWMFKGLDLIYLFLTTSETEHLFIALLTTFWEWYFHIFCSFICYWFLIWNSLLYILVTNPLPAHHLYCSMFTMSFVIWNVYILIDSNGSLVSHDLSCVFLQIFPLFWGHTKYALFSSNSLKTLFFFIYMCHPSGIYIWLCEVESNLFFPCEKPTLLTHLSILSPSPIRPLLS